MLGDNALGLFDGSLGQLIFGLVSCQLRELVLADAAASLRDLRLRDASTELLFNVRLLAFVFHLLSRAMVSLLVGIPVGLLSQG